MSLENAIKKAKDIAVKKVYIPKVNKIMSLEKEEKISGGGGNVIDEDYVTDLILELEQTKEKLKRCEEVVDGFKKNILLLEKLRQSGNNYLDVATNSIIDKLITQLKDNG